MTTSSARIAVILASKGRSEVLKRMLPHLRAQTLLPEQVILSVTEAADADFDPAERLGPGIRAERLIDAFGTCPQRNAALDRVAPGIEFVVFYDDDFFPAPNALERLAQGFADHADVDGITGKLLADGISGPGISPDEAEKILSEYSALKAKGQGGTPRILRDTYGLYGCNMAYRRSAIEGLRFDERLPTYGWQEDVDFAARLPGRRVEIEGFTGVHLGVKSGRETNGMRFGYSQVANPYYLWRKGTMNAGFALRLAFGNLLANHARALRPEPWVDRRGRLRGNWLALADMLRGRADPGRISEFSAMRG